MPSKQWDALFERATLQHGYVTSRDAADLGLRRGYLGELHAAGTLEKVAYGLYRFPQIPTTRLTPFMEAVLWAGEGAVLSHDAVLSMHELVYANPRVLRVSTPRRVRKSGPPVAVEIIRRELDPADLTVHEGIPCTTVARALRDCHGLIMPSRLIEAAHEARDQGLVRRREMEALLEDLGDVDG